MEIAITGVSHQGSGEVRLVNIIFGGLDELRELGEGNTHIGDEGFCTGVDGHGSPQSLEGEVDDDDNCQDD